MTDFVANLDRINTLAEDLLEFMWRFKGDEVKERLLDLQKFGSTPYVTTLKIYFHASGVRNSAQEVGSCSAA